jgi:hypothetical protein
LQVVDIRHPDAPRLVGLLNTPSQASYVTAAADRLYVLDHVFALQIVQGPGADFTDTDGDGVIDFFDAFLADAHEAQDTDGDGLGDRADADADNDGFSDTEEQQAAPPTDPTDARSFPVRLPPAGTATLVVDAANTHPARERNGTPQAPYRALSEALQALHAGRLPQVHLVQVRAGTYSPVTTQEIFPLELNGLVGLTLHGEGTVVLDAGGTAPVFQAESSRDLVIADFEITIGVTGITIQDSTSITIRHNRITGHSVDGISISAKATGVVITENHLADNERYGLVPLRRRGDHDNPEYHAPECPLWPRRHTWGVCHDYGQSLRTQFRLRHTHRCECRRHGDRQYDAPESGPWHRVTGKYHRHPQRGAHHPEWLP